MTIDPINFNAAPADSDEIRNVADAVAEDRGVFHARAVLRLQSAMARIACRDYAFAVSGRRAAVFLALRALGLGSGDEMLLSEGADFSLAAAVLHCGAVPVFCDLDPRTLCLSPEAAAARLSPRVKGLAAVHMYGGICDMHPLLKLAAAHGLFVLEEAGTAVAALYRGRPAGSFGHLSVFGFNGPGLPDCGVGGMLLSSSRELAGRVARLGGEGRNASNPLIYDFPAYDFALSDLAAAAALACIEDLPEMLGQKARIVGRYRRRLEDVPGLCLNPENEETRNSCIMPLLIMEGGGAGELAQRLRQCGIVTRPAFYPLSAMPLFKKADNPTAYALADCALLLPGGVGLSDDEADYVAACIKDFMRNKGREAPVPAPPERLRRKADILKRLGLIRKEGLELGFRHAGADYLLRALSADDLQNGEFVKFLRELWMENRHILFSSGEAEADLARQFDYLRKAGDALLFVVCGWDEAGGRVFFGHAGLEDFDFRRESCRMDMLIMRGGAPRGLLAAACDRLFAWAGTELGLKRMFNHISASNGSSRLLAAAHGFTTWHRMSLLRRLSPQGGHFRPILRPGREEPDDALIISAKELTPHMPMSDSRDP